MTSSSRRARVGPMFVKPAREGLKVAIPGRPGQYLEAGKWTKVAAVSYWFRQLRRGDVIEQPATDAGAEPRRSTRTRKEKPAEE